MRMLWYLLILIAFMTTLSSCKSSKQSKMDYPKHQ